MPTAITKIGIPATFSPASVSERTVRDVVEAKTTDGRNAVDGSGVHARPQKNDDAAHARRSFVLSFTSARLQPSLQTIASPNESAVPCCLTEIVFASEN
jgi:hypothetical protein